MKLSELIPFLDQINARPNKGLSQNFLVDANIVRKIVATAEVKKGDVVLEIGPGPGSLTQELLAAGAHVYAVEIDSNLSRELHRFQTPDQRLHVFGEDFLKFSLNKIPSPFKVVANLPYHVTSPILEKLCTAPFSSLTIMIQKEVAARLAAKPGTKDFSSFTLFMQYYTNFRSSFTVSAGCFYPKPNVDSSVIRMDAKNPAPVDEGFFPFVRKAFQQRRKMIRSTLGIAPEGVPDARPETLSLSEWMNLYEKSLTV